MLSGLSFHEFTVAVFPYFHQREQRKRHRTGRFYFIVLLCPHVHILITMLWFEIIKITNVLYLFYEGQDNNLWFPSHDIFLETNIHTVIYIFITGRQSSTPTSGIFLFYFQFYLSLNNLLSDTLYILLIYLFVSLYRI